MKYTQSHEWISVEGEVGTVGISDYAQKELGEVVYVDLPEIGQQIQAGQEAVVLESTKAASDVYSPVTGTILEVNELLRDLPEKVNDSPLEEGWLFKIRLADPAELDQLISYELYLESIGS